MDIREAEDEDLMSALKDRGIIVLSAFPNEALIEELASRKIDVRNVANFSDTELNNEISRRRHLVEQQYETMMGQGLV